ncbi:MAG: response regulator [Bdellovibrionota bacterium]
MPQPKRSALIVDDNETDRVLINAILKKLHFTTVQTAEDGSIGKGKLANSIDMNQPYDVVLVDWHMPKASGIELVKFLSLTLKSKKTKILMMTATADRKMIEEAIASGVDDFIIKPVEIDVLKTKLEKLFGS